MTYCKHEAISRARTMFPRSRGTNRGERVTNKTQKQMNAKIDTKRNVLIIEVTLQEPTPSSTGRTLLVASERQKFADVTVNGQPVTVQLNAHIKPQQ